MKNDLIPLNEYESPFVVDMDEMEERFCYEYAIDLNPQLAAERCGITMRKARKFLRKPMVKKAVSDIKARVLASCEINADSIVNELKRAAFFDMKSIVKDIDKEGNIKFVDFKDMDGRAISEIKVTETKTGKKIVTIKPHKATEAQKVLLDYVTGANKTQVNVQVNISDIKKGDPESAMEAYQKVMEGATIEDA